MKKHLRAISTFVIISFLSYSLNCWPEAVDDRLTQISPEFKPGSGEFIHGQGYGKILMRVIMFGAISQQGIHYFPEGTDLLFAVLSAGGLGEHTKLNGLTIRRRGVTELIKVDLENLVEDGISIPKLMDGDVVRVPFNWKRNYQEFMFYSQILFSLANIAFLAVAISRIK